MIHTFNGIPLYESPVLVVDGTPYEVHQTWCERLLSWPWRPWRATKWVVPKIPDPNVYVIDAPSGGQRIIAHPETVRRIRDLIPEEAP